MTDAQIKKNYLNAISMLAYMMTDECQNALAKKDKKVANALQENVIKTVNSCTDSMWLTKEVIELNAEISDFERLLKLTPLQSYETIKECNEAVLELSNKIATEVLFDARAYFNIYFILNGSKQISVNNNPVLNEKNANAKTTNFQSWFRNSRVIDDKGNPKLVYHGTHKAEFTRFKFDLFPGAYFAENEDYSLWFQKRQNQEGTMFQCYLRIENPIDLTPFGVDKVRYEEFVSYIELQYGYRLPQNVMLKTASDRENGLWAWQYIRGGVDWLKHIARDGYFDGLHFYENNPDDPKNGKDNITKAWLVFSSEQIKSAFGNVLYSDNSKDIRFDKGGSVQHKQSY